ncbi:MAG TPA: hypothetical protein VGW36_04375, partial [Pyrinomonadaceae bacterium]|nr:hypothetical protein [Pyrinomonadaceae bacterium]
MSEDVIHAYQTPETPPVSLQWSELTLILSGLLIVKRVELKEQKSTGGQQRIADSNQFFTDELVLELFVAGQPVPYRIAVNSFDFSCLGKEKSLLTRENITRFINVIREKAPHVVYDDSYNSVRKALEPVWPSEQQNTSSGWRRERPGKYSVGSATEISNERQFSLYSRLRNLLLVGVRAD